MNSIDRILNHVVGQQADPRYRRVNAGGTVVRQEPRIKGKARRKAAKKQARERIAAARARGHEIIIAPWGAK